MTAGFTIRHARTADEAERVARFVHGVFGAGRQYVLKHPDVQAEGSRRYVECDGRIAAALIVEKMDLVLGSGQVRAARIEHVGTDRQMRRRGLCRMLMEDTIGWLESAGVQVALIFGEPLFRRFGFEYAVPTYVQGMPTFTPPGSHVLPAAAIHEDSGPMCSIRPMQQDDLRSVAQLHRTASLAIGFSRARTPQYWEYLVGDKGLATYHVAQDANGIIGYYRLKEGPGRLEVREVVASDVGACGAILQAIGRRGRELQASMIDLYCPGNGVFGQFLARHCAARYCPHADRETNLQVRLLDLAGCLGLMRPTFAERIKRSEFADRPWHLRVDAGQSTAHVASDSEGVRVGQAARECLHVQVRPPAMAQLLAGFDVDRARPLATGSYESLRLMEILFPPQEPFWYADDV